MPRIAMAQAIAQRGWTIPQPCRSTGAFGKRTAVWINARFTSCGFRSGTASSICAAIEETIGAAKLPNDGYRPIIFDAGWQRMYVLGDPGTAQYLKNIVMYMGLVGCKAAPIGPIH